jgi:hypothetical protein
MSENDNKNLRNDEIDLLDLFRRINKSLIKLFSAIGRAFLISIVFLLKRWLPLGLSILIGIGFSYYKKSTSESVYTSDMVLKTNIIQVSDLIDYINRLNIYCSERNELAIAEALGVNKEQVKNIVDISAYWVIDKRHDSIPDFVDYNDSHDVYDTTNVRMKDRIDIRAKTTYSQELTNIREGIVRYINSDSLFQQRNRIRIQQNKDFLSRLNYDIIQLDSLQKVKYFEETRNRKTPNGAQMVFLQEQNTQLVYKDIYGLYKRKQKLELENDLYKDLVTVLSDFSSPTRRDNGTLFYGKHYIPICFCITLLFLIIFANRKRIIDIYKKY